MFQLIYGINRNNDLEVKNEYCSVSFGNIVSTDNIIEVVPIKEFKILNSPNFTIYNGHLILPSGCYKISGTLTITSFGKFTNNLADQNYYIELRNGLTIDNSSRICLLQGHDIDYVASGINGTFHIFVISFSTIISSTEQLSIFIDINENSGASISTYSDESWLIVEKII